MKYTLGTNLITHDTAFYLLDDNARLVFGVEEEKIAKARYHVTYSAFALDYMLRRAGIDKKDIVAVGTAFSLEEYQNLFRRHADLYGNEMAERHASVIKKQFEYGYNLIDSAGLKNAKLFEVPHHLSHAMSAFSLSPYKSAAVIVIDGNGEDDTTTLYHATGSDMVKIAAIKRPHSMGWVWEAITTKWLRLGIKGNEGKTMGLAAYGRPKYKNMFYEGFDTKIGKVPIFRVDWDTGLFESPAMKEVYGWNLTIHDILGPSEEYSSIPNEYQRDIAATLQEVTNEIFLALSRYMKRTTGEENLVISGGVAMNSVANGVVERSGIFKNVFIPPNASDNGCGLGAGLYAHNALGHRKTFKVETVLPYTSCGFDDEEISDELRRFDLPCERSSDFIKETSDELMKGSIVGWFQGRLELGARALGDRSILTLPYPGEMKDKVNLRVKFREYWRPFAPVIKEENFSEWFEGNASRQPYMTSTQPFKASMGKRVEAVLHNDGTGRVQTCNFKENEKLYRLLSEIERRSSVPILLNTSFNIKGMPIVASPEDAILCFLCTDIDVLVIGDHVIRKSQIDSRRVSLSKVSHSSRFLEMTLPERGTVLFVTDGSAPEKALIDNLLKEISPRQGVTFRVVSQEESIADIKDIVSTYLISEPADIFSKEFIDKIRPKMELVYPLVRDRAAESYCLNMKGASFVLTQILSRKNWDEIVFFGKKGHDQVLQEV